MKNKNIFISDGLLVIQPIIVRVTPSGEVVESSHDHTKRVWVKVKNNKEIPFYNALAPNNTPPYFYPYSFK